MGFPYRYNQKNIIYYFKIKLVSKNILKSCVNTEKFSLIKLLYIAALEMVTSEFLILAALNQINI